jgi:hypothetical protein
MNEILKTYALEYLEKVNLAVELITKGMGFPKPENPLTWLRHYPVQKGSFELDGKNKFVLHGFGCDFRRKKSNVNWDFGMDGEWNGISPWKFTEFISEKPDLPKEFKDWIWVKSEMNNAVKAGEMEFRDDLFYFTLKDLRDTRIQIDNR